MVHLWNYDTYLNVEERSPFFIEEVYNKKQLHLTLGYPPPEEFEEMSSGEIKRKPVPQPVLELEPI